MIRSNVGIAVSKDRAVAITDLRASETHPTWVASNPGCWIAGSRMSVRVTSTSTGFPVGALSPAPPSRIEISRGFPAAHGWHGSRL